MFSNVYTKKGVAFIFQCRLNKEHHMKTLSTILILLFVASNSWAEEKTFETDKYSTIKTDGQLIPVGEKHRYTNSYKTWNVWTNPFGYFFGDFNAGVSYAVHQNIKINLEPQIVYFYLSSPKVVGGGATLSTSIFFNKVYDGFYLEPGGRFLYLSQRRTIGNSTVTGPAGGPQLIAGWAWTWDSGFTINAGLGIGYFWGQVGKDVTDTNAFKGVVPAGNLQFGYSF
jgi:hypothetical protein